MEAPPTEAPVEATGFTSFLHKLCREACQKLLSARTALTALVARMLAAIATALPAKAPAATPVETTPAAPDKHRLMASQILADARGKQKLRHRDGRNIWKVDGLTSHRDGEIVREVEALMMLTTLNRRQHRPCWSWRLLTLPLPNSNPLQLRRLEPTDDLRIRRSRDGHSTKAEPFHQNKPL